MSLKKYLKSYMKLIIVLVTIIYAIITPAYAEGEPAFLWPDAYSFTSTTSSKTKEFEPFVNVYYKDGLKARNQTKSGVEIFRVDLNKKYFVDTAGKVTETDLPEDWSLSNFFPPNSEWKYIGQYTINGLTMNKYTLTNKAGAVDVWLSADNKIPIGMETKETTLEFSSFSDNRSDPRIFEVPVK